MVQLSYTLLEEEVVRYYEMIMLHTPSKTKLPRIFTIAWGPVLAIALVFAFKVNTSIVWWIVALSFCVVWILFIAPFIYRKMAHRMAEKQFIKDGSVLKQLHVMEKDGLITLDGEVKKPENYAVYYDLFIIGFADHTNLLVPERAFKNDEKLMEQFIRDIMVYSEAEDLTKTPERLLTYNAG